MSTVVKFFWVIVSILSVMANSESANVTLTIRQNGTYKCSTQYSGITSFSLDKQFVMRQPATALTYGQYAFSSIPVENDTPCISVNRRFSTTSHGGGRIVASRVQQLGVGQISVCADNSTMAFLDSGVFTIVSPRNTIIYLISLPIMLSDSSRYHIYAEYEYNDYIRSSDAPSQRLQYIVDYSEPAVSTNTALLPNAITLCAVPNPFNSVTTIQYDLPVASLVQLVVFDVTGRQVTTLVSSQSQEAGNYTLRWNAKPYCSGVYFVRIQAGTSTNTKKLILLQ